MQLEILNLFQVVTSMNAG